MAMESFQQNAFQNDAFQIDWVTQLWSYQLDGNELNNSTFVVTIPEIDDRLSIDPVMVLLQNDYPLYIRSQALSRVLNINIQIVPSTWSTYQSCIAWLRGIFSAGPHTLTVRARGMTASKSIVVVATSFAIGDPKARRVSIQVTAPEPDWV